MKHQAYQVYLRQYSYNIMQVVEEDPLMVEATALKVSHLPFYPSLDHMVQVRESCHFVDFMSIKWQESQRGI
jgi:hypothetical protein